MPIYKLTRGSEVIFQAENTVEVVRRLIEIFPPDGAFPSPNSLNDGFAIVLPEGKRLQGLLAARWIAQHK